MPVFKLPLSGDVVQSIYPSFFSPTGGQFGLVNITVGQSSAPDVEKDVLSDVAGYGKQIGQIADALLTVIEHLEAHPGNVLADDQAIAAFKELMHSVATVKETPRPQGVPPETAVNLRLPAFRHISAQAAL